MSVRKIFQIIFIDLLIIINSSAMRKLLMVVFFISICLHINSQSIDVERDTIKRDVLHYNDIMVLERDGYCTIGYKSSVPEYNRKKLTGKFLFKDTNGWEIDMELIDNVANGNWQYYSSTFQGPMISSTVSFVDGYKDGIENTYSNEWYKEKDCFESILTGITKYNLGKKVYKKSYFNNGQLLLESFFDEDGKEHGEYTFYSANGTVEIQGQYLHGKKDGLWKEFYYTGELKSETLYRNDSIYTNTYHVNGKPYISKTTYCRMYEGDYLIMMENGDTITHQFYKNGIQQGNQLYGSTKSYYEPIVLEYYHINDNALIEGEYCQLFIDTRKPRVKGYYNEKGMRDGRWEYYLRDGRLYRTEDFEDGWVRASHTRKLVHMKTKNYLYLPEYHLEYFRRGTIYPKLEEIPFFLFSE